MGTHVRCCLTPIHICTVNCSTTFQVPPFSIHSREFRHSWEPPPPNYATRLLPLTPLPHNCAGGRHATHPGGAQGLRRVRQAAAGGRCAGGQGGRGGGAGSASARGQGRPGAGEAQGEGFRTPLEGKRGCGYASDPEPQPGGLPQPACREYLSLCVLAAVLPLPHAPTLSRPRPTRRRLLLPQLLLPGCPAGPGCSSARSLLFSGPSKKRRSLSGGAIPNWAPQYGAAGPGAGGGDSASGPAGGSGNAPSGGSGRRAAGGVPPLGAGAAAAAEGWRRPCRAVWASRRQRRVGASPSGQHPQCTHVHGPCAVPDMPQRLTTVSARHTNIHADLALTASYCVPLSPCLQGRTRTRQRLWACRHWYVPSLTLAAGGGSQDRQDAKLAACTACALWWPGAVVTRLSPHGLVRFPSNPPPPGPRPARPLSHFCRLLPLARLPRATATWN